MGKSLKIFRKQIAFEVHIPKNIYFEYKFGVFQKKITNLGQNVDLELSLNPNANRVLGWTQTLQLDSMLEAHMHSWMKATM